PAGQFGDEPVDERVGWPRTRLPDNEFRQAGIQVRVELTVQLTPVGRHQLGRVDVRPTATDRGDQLRRQLAVGDRQRDAEVIWFDLPPGLRGRALDRPA